VRLAIRSSETSNDIGNRTRDISACSTVFEDETNGKLKNGVFWDVTPCGEPTFRRNLSAYFIRVTGIGELGTTLAATSNRRTLRRNTKSYTSHTA
jgi:hypothetical protein